MSFLNVSIKNNQNITTGLVVCALMVNPTNNWCEIIYECRRSSLEATLCPEFLGWWQTETYWNTWCSQKGLDILSLSSYGTLFLDVFGSLELFNFFYKEGKEVSCNTLLLRIFLRVLGFLPVPELVKSATNLAEKMTSHLWFNSFCAVFPRV